MSHEVTERSDREELREILLAFMDKYRGPDAGPGKLRLHKFVFISDLYCLHWYGRRMTDANFKAYDYGAYAEDIQRLLMEMVRDGDAETFETRFSNEPQYRNTRDPRLSQEKLDIIDEVWETVYDMSDDELEQLSKGSWLYENTDYDCQMDWDQYQEMVGSPTTWRRVVSELDERRPVEDNADSVEGILE